MKLWTSLFVFFYLLQLCLSKEPRVLSKNIHGHLPQQEDFAVADNGTLQFWEMELNSICKVKRGTPMIEYRSSTNLGSLQETLKNSQHSRGRDILTFGLQMAEAAIMLDPTFPIMQLNIFKYGAFLLPRKLELGPELTTFQQNKSENGGSRGGGSGVCSNRLAIVSNTS